MSQFLIQLLAVAICLTGMLAVLIPLFVMIKYRDKTVKIPIDREQLQRLPGFGLQREIRDRQFDLLGNMSMSICIVSIPFAYFAVLAFLKTHNFPTFIVIFVVIGTLWCSWRTVKVFKHLTRLRLGHTAELATAAELLQLQAKGYQVFHDIQADNFNIDHLVVGPNGVFAIETKGRHKRLSERNNKHGLRSHECIYADNQLRFPKWTETKPLEQTVRQAKWVSQWLSSSTMFDVTAKPVLVLPGWYIKLQSKPPFPIVNHKQLAKVLPSFGNNRLTAEQINAICWQVAQRCIQGPEDKK